MLSLKGRVDRNPCQLRDIPYHSCGPSQRLGTAEGQGKNRRARGEPVAEPREAPINTRSGYDASEGVPGGSQDASVWVHLASFLERSLATFLGRLEH